VFQAAPRRSSKWVKGRQAGRQAGSRLGFVAGGLWCGVVFGGTGRE